MMYKLLPTRVFRAYSGGVHLDEWENKQIPQITRFPEDWLASVTQAFNPGREDATEGLSITEDGQYLKQLIENDPEGMLGKHKEMTLLFKLLDTNERLVIQVHPNVSFAKQYFKSNYGKTECWYFLNDGGYVYLGFREGITKEYWRSLFESQNIPAMLKCMHRFDVKKGQMIFVNGGVPHAIGAGCFLAELQEPTDLMVIPERITPSGVVLSEQKLHGGLGFERMMDCFIYHGASREETFRKHFCTTKKLDNSMTVLVDESITDKFRLIKLEIQNEYQLTLDSYAIVIVINGCIRINNVPLKKGDRLFVTANQHELCIKGNGELLISMP